MAFQRRSDPPITIGQILELAPGDKDNKQWINGVLTCGICDVKPNKIGFSATLFDPSNTNVAVTAKFFGSGIDRLEGQVITLSGGGMSWGEYKGQCELAVGQKCRIECEGQATPAFQAPPAPRASVPVRTPAPAASVANRWVSAPTAGHPAGRSTSEDIALGRASNNAIALLAKFGADKPIDWLDSDDFRMRAYILISDLLAIEKAVAHKPAPTSKQRAGGMSVRQPADPVAEVEEEPAPAPAPVKPVSRGVPGPSGAAYPPAAPAANGEVEDEIPFNGPR
jgi:hypothetical protein